MLIDSHCHLDRLVLENYDDALTVVLDSAHERGVKQFLCVGISLDNREEVVKLAEKYPSVVSSIGIHPLDVNTGLASEVDLVHWAKHPKVVALGETGLDYHYSVEEKSTQQESFIIHLKAAKKAELPVIVHTREAREDTISLIKRYGCLENAGVLHCFTENWIMAKQALDLNYMISISGIVTFRNATELRDVVKQIPLDRLLVETDSPYLAPVPYRGKPNQPKYVREVAEYIAGLHNIALEEIAEITSSNFYRLFPKAEKFSKSGE